MKVIRNQSGNNLEALYYFNNTWGRGAMIQKHLETDAALPAAPNASELSPQSACRESNYRNTGHIKISLKRNLIQFGGN